jgi:cytoskeletal protein CcmA (bactofilin family)
MDRQAQKTARAATFPARNVSIIDILDPGAPLFYGRNPARDRAMSDNPKRRLIDQIGISPTFVAEGCRVTGDVETSGPLVVLGAIRGDGHVGGALSMSAKSAWEGEIHARAAVIAGRISGKLVIEEKLEIGATAVIRADIVAKSIAVAKGAVIDGEVTITSGQPMVQFEEKRSFG